MLGIYLYYFLFRKNKCENIRWSWRITGYTLDSLVVSMYFLKIKRDCKRSFSGNAWFSMVPLKHLSDQYFGRYFRFSRFKSNYVLIIFICFSEEDMPKSLLLRNHNLKKISVKNEKYQIYIWSWQSFKDKQSFYIILPSPYLT